MPEHELTDDELLTAWAGTLRAVAAARALLSDEIRETSGLSPPEFEVLARLLRADRHRLTTTRLAREVSFSSGGFTKLADRLVSAGLVERRPSARDRRVIYTELTEPGLKLASATLDAYLTTLRSHVLDVVGDERFASATAAMCILRDALCEPVPDDIDEPAPE